MPVTLDRVTIAVLDMPAMVAFYNTVFEADLLPVEPGSEFEFYLGDLAGLELFFVPNQIPQIVAEKNRQQLRLVVDDVEETITLATRVGGQKIGDVQVGDNFVAGGITDPDGNSIELIQYIP